MSDDEEELIEAEEEQLETCKRCAFMGRIKDKPCLFCSGIDDKELGRHVALNGDKCSIYHSHKIIMKDIYDRLRNLEGWRDFDK